MRESDSTAGAVMRGHEWLDSRRDDIVEFLSSYVSLASVNPETGGIFCDFIPSLDQNQKSYDGAWTMTTTPSHLWVGGGFIGVSDSINPRSNPITTNPEVRQSNLARFRF